MSKGAEIGSERADADDGGAVVGRKEVGMVEVREVAVGVGQLALGVGELKLGIGEWLEQAAG